MPGISCASAYPKHSAKTGQDAQMDLQESTEDCVSLVVNSAGYGVHTASFIQSFRDRFVGICAVREAARLFPMSTSLTGVYHVNKSRGCQAGPCLVG